jgi:hypothetical protein
MSSSKLGPWPDTRPDFPTLTGVLRSNPAEQACPAQLVYHLRSGCYTSSMPTTRPRHLITETDQVAKALDDAARRWPEDRHSRARLLLHLVEEGHRALVGEADERRQARLAAIRKTSGSLAGIYDGDYLERLREDWPA